MKKILKKISVYVFLSALAVSCTSTPKYTPKKTTKPLKTNSVSAKKTPSSSVAQPIKSTEKKSISAEKLVVKLPEMKREFRAAWVASVANINWPSKRNLTPEEQKQEAIGLLELLYKNNFNAAILQIRPSADALYKSDIEPWSYFLTGEVGKTPSPYYDPLEFWVEEAHKRGIELHVWLNPYRAHHPSGGGVSPLSMVQKQPENIVKLKNGTYWFDPSSKKTQDHTIKVVRDIVKRYDIDAVHFDDYFYPYAEYNGGADFPDQKTWNEYKNSGGNLSKADWRRNSVNTFVERVYREIKEQKPYVKFGISPFGIWKAGYPEGVVGSSQYDELYADAKLWLNKGWVDYFAPQLYWAIDSKQSFPALLQWWSDENTQKRHLWPGINTVEVRVKDRVLEINKQISLNREILKTSPGEIHWSIKGLTHNEGMLKSLASGAYKEPSLVPKSPWIQPEVKMEAPHLKMEKKNNLMSLNFSSETKIFKWVLYLKYGQNWETKILLNSEKKYDAPIYKNGQKLEIIALQSIDRLGNESPYTAQKVN